MSSTFCILPWHQSTVWVDGTVRLCCRAALPVKGPDGRALSLEDVPFQEIWNSEHMIGVRRAMVEGRRVADCENCYAHEATMGTSKRMESNAAWLGNMLAEDQVHAVDRIKERSESIGHVVRRSPFALHLWFGNVCNLRCRMCNPTCSSRIARDPVHAPWSATEAPLVPSAHPRYHDARFWFDSPTVVLEDLFPEPNKIDDLAFAGGEPLLQKQIVPLLQALVDRGRAPHMRLYFSTNGTIFSPALAELLRPFQKVTLAVSIDGVGALNDYIRNGVHWPSLVENVRRMQELPWLQLIIEPTFQAYNVLRMTDVLRFCDTEGLPYGLSNMLQWPRHLSFDALPLACREVAAARVEAYAATAAPASRPGLDACLRALRGPLLPDQPQLLETFMRFTNALDASRDERLIDVEPELVALLAEAGFPWRDEAGPGLYATEANAPASR